MKKYNYLEAVKEDVRSWINWHDEWRAEYADEDGKWLREDNRDEIEQDLRDRLWVEDSVTGNACGSYTCNAWQAEENLCHNLDLLREAFDEFCCDDRAYREAMESAECCDVTIRCYLLGEAIHDVLREIEK